MSAIQRKIQNILYKQKYNEWAVTDAVQFEDCIAMGSEEAVRAKLKKIDNTAQLAKFNPKGASPRTFFQAVDHHSQSEVGVSECSNFAVHGIGLLMLDPDIKNHYQFVIAGIMGGQHNIGLLIPIRHSFEKPKTINDGLKNLPEGTLVVDPWGVGMGHNYNDFLGVPIDKYYYNNSLQKVVMHYTSDKKSIEEALAVRANKREQSQLRKFQKEQERTNENFRILFSNIQRYKQSHQESIPDDKWIKIRTDPQIYKLIEDYKKNHGNQLPAKQWFSEEGPKLLLGQHQQQIRELKEDKYHGDYLVNRPREEKIVYFL